MLWTTVQGRIDACRRCEEGRVPHLRVPDTTKRHPAFAPPIPTRIYFVSVAPPWGGTYFWDESERDAVREGLFDALRSALRVSLNSCAEFHQLGFHLSPAVKCPSERKGKDYHPAKRAARNCEDHLLGELGCARAERILALGRVPFQSLSHLFSLDTPEHVEDFHGNLWWVPVRSREVPLSGTYFPGNDRHQGFHHIPVDIAGLLAVDPRNRDA